MVSARHTGRRSTAGMNAAPDVVLNRMTVNDGRLVLPDGMSYRLLVLPESATMTPALLAQDQATGRGRRDRRRAAANAIAQPERLPEMR